MTIITINCLDGTSRIIKVEGNWAFSTAESLARDIEGSNYRSLSISK